MKPQTNSLSQAKRLDWADYGKGLAILLVVICHTVNGLFRADIFKGNPAWNYFDDVCFSFMVPVFFFISGYFSERSLSRKGISQIATAQLGSLVYPYFVWSAAQTILMILTDGSNAKPSWKSLLMLPFQAQMQFWFLYTLILAIAISLLLSAAKLTTSQKLIFAIGFYIVGSLYTLDWSPYNWVSHSYLYFAIGGAFPALSQDKFKARDLISQTVVSSMALNYLVLHHAGRATDLQAVGALAGVSLIIALSLLLDKLRALDWVKVLGAYSLEIFCLHSIAAALVRYALLRKLSIQSLPAHLVMGLTAALLVPLIAAKAAKRWNLSLFRLSLEARMKRKEAAPITSREAVVLG